MDVFLSFKWQLFWLLDDKEYAAQEPSQIEGVYLQIKKEIIRDFVRRILFIKKVFRNVH